MDSYDIYKSLEEKIKKKIKQNENYIDKIKEEKGNIFNKALNKITIKQNEEENIALIKFKKILFEFRHYTSSSNNYRLPQGLENKLHFLSYALENEERSSLKLTINSCLKHENYYKKIPLIKEQAKKVEKAAENAFPSGTEIHVHNEFTTYGLHTITKLLHILENEKIEKLDSTSYIIDLPKIEPTGLEEDLNLYKIDRMMKDEYKFNNKEMNKIKANYQNIRKNQIEKIRLEKVLDKLDSTIPAFKQEMKNSGVDFKSVITELEEIKQNSSKKLKEANAYLSKFNLDIIEKELEYYEKSIEEKNHREKYMNIVYDREMALAEGNLAKAEELRKKMIATGAKYDNYELERMQQEMKNKASNDRYIEQITKEAKKTENKINKNHNTEKQIMSDEEKEIIYQKEMINYSLEDLRELALERLNKKGIEVDIEKDQALIEKEIEDMIKIAYMTPIQRAEQAGESYRFYNDLLLFHGDAAVTQDDFNVKMVREANDSYKRNMRIQATNIAKEYLKYRRNNSDKNNYMKYSEFAKVMYGYSNMTESMINDPDVLDEVKGIKR